MEQPPGFERYRELFAKELAAGEARQWSAAEIFYYRIRSELRLAQPDGGDVAEFLLHVEDDEAWWRWNDEPFDEGPEVIARDWNTKEPGSVARRDALRAVPGTAGVREWRCSHPECVSGQDDVGRLVCGGDLHAEAKDLEVLG